ncbi:hypothetical protein F7725_019681 [Dissostichus mawsoni]|uniref:WxxW domain-containing protein n=1 Tax=Dissostichus mawsoni TaxID=36200 RepID=A0A7J5YKD8_DISMA|nr:hypothetical protein F7725_019681 [Dissostichus mawsoni]
MFGLLMVPKYRTIEGLSPTQAALIQHTKRAAFQTGHCWGQMMFAAPELPSPDKTGDSSGGGGGGGVFTPPAVFKETGEHFMNQTVPLRGPAESHQRVPGPEDPEYPKGPEDPEDPVVKPGEFYSFLPSRPLTRLLHLAVCWTDWFDRDNPSGSGDWELSSDLRKENPGKICEPCT